MELSLKDLEANHVSCSLVWPESTEQLLLPFYILFSVRHYVDDVQMTALPLLIESST